MSSHKWRVSLIVDAERDLSQILGYTIDNFGAQQARRYKALLMQAIRSLRDGPAIAGSVARHDIAPGLRRFPIARRGKPARHFILYRAVDGQVIEVLRILHEAMDVTTHVH